jgi:hypothetical protein
MSPAFLVIQLINKINQSNTRLNPGALWKTSNDLISLLSHGGDHIACYAESMRVILFGATGMVGQGVLRECLLDPGVQEILSIGRTATEQHHSKLRQLAHTNFFDFSAMERELSGFDACFFCLGVSSAGMAEADYRRVTYDITLAAAGILVKLNSGMTFIYVSGTGTDSTERGRSMWARVKGQTENALLRLPFKAAYMFRPGIIVPLHGVRSKTRLYRITYSLTAPLLRFRYPKFPRYMTTSERIGRAMIRIVRNGSPKSVLENSEINRV